MRSVIWLVLLFTAAVVTATMLGPNDALVSVFYGTWRLDLSLNLFLLMLLVGLFLLFVALQAINALLALPTRAREWRELKRERAAQAALRQALAELFAARYARAQRAAERALDLRLEVPALRDDAEFAVLAQLIAATGLHRLQDRRGRDERVRQALTQVREAGSAGEGALLLHAEWALDDRDAVRGQAVLTELPAGVARRTQALRLKLQASRLLKRPLEALQTARLLAKHQGFSSVAAQALLRSLALESLEQAHDEEQLRRAWQALDSANRKDAWVTARAARRARELGHPSLGRDWLQAAWEQMGRADAESRRQLALALVDCAPGLGNEWLPRVEAALQSQGHEPALLAAAGMAFAERQLWGKARRPLEQTALADSLPLPVRRLALRRLAAMAREQGNEAEAASFDRRAALLD